MLSSSSARGGRRESGMQPAGAGLVEISFPLEVGGRTEGIEGTLALFGRICIRSLSGIRLMVVFSEVRAFDR